VRVRVFGGVRLDVADLPGARLAGADGERDNRATLPLVAPARSSGTPNGFPMAKTYKTTRRVEFRDTDAAGMVHFSVFFVYMEEAEHALLRELDMSVVTADDHGPVSFPRVAARCDYQRAARFEDVLVIETEIVRLGKKSVTYEFNFSHDGRPVASGQTTTVCCRFDQEGTPKSITIPPAIAEKLKAAMA
jgi:acyl-CoA thioester hydrolase